MDDKGDVVYRNDSFVTPEFKGLAKPVNAKEFWHQIEFKLPQRTSIPKNRSTNTLEPKKRYGLGESRFGVHQHIGPNLSFTLGMAVGSGLELGTEGSGHLVQSLLPPRHDRSHAEETVDKALIAVQSDGDAGILQSLSV